MIRIVKGWVMSVPIVCFYLKGGVVLYSLLNNSFRKNSSNCMVQESREHSTYILERVR